MASCLPRVFAAGSTECNDPSVRIKFGFQRTLQSGIDMQSIPNEKEIENRVQQIQLIRLVYVPFARYHSHFYLP